MKEFIAEIIAVCEKHGLVIDIETMNGGGYLRVRKLEGISRDDYLNSLRNMEFEEG